MKYRLAFVLVLCGFLLIGTASAWYDSDWTYRKTFTVNNTGSALTDYQIMFTVNRSAGSDSGTTVYLNGKCESDYDDIRFVAADDATLYDYWIESSSSTFASVWVNFTSLPTGDTDCYLYYGNSGASAVSNGTNTFPFFDDFPGSSIDSSKWTSITGSGVSVSGGVVTCTASSDAPYGIDSKNAMGTSIAVRAKIKPGHYDSTSYLEAVCPRRADDTHALVCYYSHVAGGSYPTSYYQTDGSSSLQQMTGGASDWFIQEAKLGASSAIYTINDADAVTHSTNYYATSNKIRILGYGSGSIIYCDWVLVRKYTATEPTSSTWGSEEISTPKSLIPDFTGIPTSGYVPLTVYFNDNSTANNCTVDTWQWSFGDSTSNATSENPAHTYTTTGLYDVILTITNTSFYLTNSTIKTDYINVTSDVNAPTADFTITETCGDVGDTFYFIDYSTGGGLYQWNWSFGDGEYSELRNPTHQYDAEGTYDVNLTVWGAYGTDSFLRENLITVPCGAATPTPTPTVTPTGTPGNITEGNITYIQAPDKDYVPFPIWLAIVIVSIAFFGHSLIFIKNSDLTASLAALFTFVSAWLSNMIGYIDVQVTSVAEDIMISPVVQAVHPPWLVYTMLIFAFVSVVNIFAAIYKVYLKPTPWNEIYNRKLPKWQGRR